MKKWQGNWTFQNEEHPQHGSAGTKTVEARGEPEANATIRHLAAVELFGASVMVSYFSVGGVHEVWH